MKRGGKGSLSEGFSPLTLKQAAIRLPLAKKEQRIPGIGAGGAPAPPTRHPEPNSSRIGRPNWAKVGERERRGAEDDQGGRGHCWNI